MLYFRYEVMKRCWMFNASERPNFSEVVKAIDLLNDTSQSKELVKKESAGYLSLHS